GLGSPVRSVPSSGVSTKTKSRTLEGPALLTTTVYSTVVPATIVAGPVLAIDRSATTVTGSVSVAVLSDSLASPTPAAPVTVAELVTVPGVVSVPGGVPVLPWRVLSTSARAVSTTALPAPGSTLISVSMSPDRGPDTVQVDVPDALHCHWTLVNIAGSKRSTTRLPTADAGPAFVTVIV